MCQRITQIAPHNPCEAKKDKKTKQAPGGWPKNNKAHSLSLFILHTAKPFGKSHIQPVEIKSEQ